MRTFNFDSDSSVYTQVAADLRGVAGWKESQKKGDVNADLWLVDGRKKGAIPYGVLGRNGQTDTDSNIAFLISRRVHWKTTEHESTRRQTAPGELLPRIWGADAQEQYDPHPPHPYT